MDKMAAHHRLTAAGLDPSRATALTDLLWNVYRTGEIAEVDFAHLSDAGFRHLEICVIGELLAVALSRRHGAAREMPVATLLAAFADRAEDR